MINIKKTRKFKAMSLVEILISVTLFLLIIGMVFPIYKLNFSVDKKLRVSSDAVKRLFIIFNRMSDDLRQATEVWITKNPTLSKPVKIYTTSGISYYLDKYYTDDGKIYRNSNVLGRKIYYLEFNANYSGTSLNYIVIKMKLKIKDNYSKTDKYITLSRIINLPNNPLFYSY